MRENAHARTHTYRGRLGVRALQQGTSPPSIEVILSMVLTSVAYLLKKSWVDPWAGGSVGWSDVPYNKRLQVPIPSPGTYLDCRYAPLSLSLSLSLSLKSIKVYPRVRIKKKKSKSWVELAALGPQNGFFGGPFGLLNLRGKVENS